MDTYYSMSPIDIIQHGIKLCKGLNRCVIMSIPYSDRVAEAMLDLGGCLDEETLMERLHPGWKDED